MGLTKLTLEIDDALIEKVRQYGERHGNSVSEVASRLLNALPEQGREEYTPAVRRLLGLLPPEADIVDYHRYLEEKHGR